MINDLGSLPWYLSETEGGTDLKTDSNEMGDIAQEA